MNALAQNVVGDAEALKEAGILGHSQQLFVGDHNHRVYVFNQLLQAAFGLLQAALAFKCEGPRDYCHSQHAQLAGQRGDHRRGACACATAQAGGDEDHIRSLQRFDDLLRVFKSSAAANIGVGAGAQAHREPHAKLELYRSLRCLERLHIGVGGDKLHAFHVGGNHTVYRIAAATTHADYLDAGSAHALFVVLNAHLAGSIGLGIHRVKSPDSASVNNWLQRWRAAWNANRCSLRRGLRGCGEHTTACQ